MKARLATMSSVFVVVGQLSLLTHFEQLQKKLDAIFASLSQNLTWNVLVFVNSRKPQEASDVLLLINFILKKDLPVYCHDLQRHPRGVNQE